jgi:signal transduction histidine kinase
MLGTLVPSATAVAAVGLWPMWHTAVAVALVTLALFAALFAAGVVLLAEPGQVPAGIAMVLSAVLLIVSWANEWGVGPLPLASDVVGNLWVPVVAWALYRYPQRRLACGDRWMFTVVLVWFVASSWLLVFLSRPEWHRFPPHWWPVLFPSLAVYQVVARVVDVGTVGLALLYVSWWVVRLRRAGGVERRIKTPTAAAAIAAVTIGSTLYLGDALNVPDPVSNVLFVVTMCSMLAIPVAFLVAVIRRYLSRSALTQVLISLGSSPTTNQITAALREGLRDPGLRIWYWSQDERSYLDEAGQPVADPRGEVGDPLVVEIRSSTGDRLALMVADAALDHDPDLIEAAVVAVRFSMENALLLETVQARLADLQAASARIVQAGARERRRIQQDLHDGIQGRLNALAPRLGAVKATTTDQRAAASIADIRDALAQALTDLRKLAAGIRPDVLNLGLNAAVTDICRPYQPGLTITIDLPEVSVPEPVEYTAFLAISEAMTNVAKHARARSAGISGQLQDGVLTVSVTDDGIGGARPNHAGTGLASITDRITALQGHVQISSPPGQGTRVTMKIPCA